MTEANQGRNRQLITFAVFYAIYAVYVILLHIRVRVDIGDDTVARVMVSGFSLPDWVVYRYHNWSSRFVEEGLGYILVQNPLLWRILDALLMGSIPLLFAYLAGGKLAIFSATVLFLLYPINLMEEAGWICTTNAYLWPVVFALLACCVLYADYYKPERTKKWYVWAIFLLALVNAADHELMAAYLMMILAAYLPVHRKQHHRISRIALCGLVIAALEILLTLLSPGNKNRMNLETANQLPEFAGYGIIDKVVLGIIKTYRVLIETNDALFWILCIGVMTCGFLYVRNPVKKLICAVPVLGMIVRNTAYSYLAIEKITVIQYTDSNIYRPLMLFAGIVVPLVLSIWFIFSEEGKWQGAVMPVVSFVGGIATLVAMGLSPTVYASGNRTSIFLYFGMIYTGLWLVLLFAGKEKKEGRILTASTMQAVTCVLFFLCVLFCALNIKGLAGVA